MKGNPALDNKVDYYRKKEKITKVKGKERGIIKRKSLCSSILGIILHFFSENNEGEKEKLDAFHSLMKLSNREKCEEVSSLNKQKTRKKKNTRKTQKEIPPYRAFAIDLFRYFEGNLYMFLSFVPYLFLLAVLGGDEHLACLKMQIKTRTSLKTDIGQ